MHRSALRAIVRLQGTECIAACLFLPPDCARYRTLSPGLLMIEPRRSFLMAEKNCHLTNCGVATLDLVRRW